MERQKRKLFCGLLQYIYTCVSQTCAIHFYTTGYSRIYRSVKHQLEVLEVDIHLHQYFNLVRCEQLWSKCTCISVCRTVPCMYSAFPKDTYLGNLCACILFYYIQDCRTISSSGSGHPLPSGRKLKIVTSKKTVEDATQVNIRCSWDNIAMRVHVHVSVYMYVCIYMYVFQRPFNST